MAKGSGGTKSSSWRDKVNYNATEHIDMLKESIVSYSERTMYHNADGISKGFHDDVAALVSEISKGDYGLATNIAKSYNNGGSRFQLSEKQAYVLAKAAVDNNLIHQNESSRVLNYHKLKDVRQKVTQKKQAEAAKKQAAKVEYKKNYTKSTTKVAVGSKVTNKKGKQGVISSIITKSTGYVTVKYPDGTTSKEMAFNLTGEDGNPLKKKKF